MRDETPLWLPPPPPLLPKSATAHMHSQAGCVDNEDYTADFCPGPLETAQSTKWKESLGARRGLPAPAALQQLRGRRNAARQASEVAPLMKELFAHPGGGEALGDALDGLRDKLPSLGLAVAEYIQNNRLIPTFVNLLEACAEWTNKTKCLLLITGIMKFTSDDTFYDDLSKLIQADIIDIILNLKEGHNDYTVWQKTASNMMENIMSRSKSPPTATHLLEEYGIARIFDDHKKTGLVSTNDDYDSRQFSPRFQWVRKQKPGKRMRDDEQDLWQYTT